MALLTTTIGSYPKPDYLRLPAFQPKHPDPTRRYSAYLEDQSDADRALLRRAIREAVRHQVATITSASGTSPTSSGNLYGSQWNRSPKGRK